MIANLWTRHSIVVTTSNIDGTSLVLNNKLWWSSGQFWPIDQMVNFDQLIKWSWWCCDHLLATIIIIIIIMTMIIMNTMMMMMTTPWFRGRPSTCWPPLRPPRGSRPSARRRLKPLDYQIKLLKWFLFKINPSHGSRPSARRRSKP